MVGRHLYRRTENFVPYLILIRGKELRNQVFKLSGESGEGEKNSTEWAVTSTSAQVQHLTNIHLTLRGLCGKARKSADSHEKRRQDPEMKIGRGGETS